MNAESSLKWPDTVNTALVIVKDSLRQVAEVDDQLEASRQLKIARPELAKQLELAEKFYVARRRELLDLEESISTLVGIREALASLLDRYETERYTVEGRLLLSKNSMYGRDAKSDADVPRELGARLSEVSQRCLKIATTVQEIREALQEYSTLSSRESPIPSQQAAKNPETSYPVHLMKREAEAK